MARILITGGTGLIGMHLSTYLDFHNHLVAHLTRDVDKPASFQPFLWDYKRGYLNDEAVAHADYIIHLAGAGIGDKRWTAERKKELRDSRVETGKLLVEAIKRTGAKPKAFITSSGVNYYGLTPTQVPFVEEDKAGNDFLGQLCVEWEQPAREMADLGIRSVIFRTGVVLTPKGGALEEMARYLKFGINPVIGTGKQYFPWVHFMDLIEIYRKAMEDDSMEGVYNVVAPELATNKSFAKALKKAKKSIAPTIPVPPIALRILFGEMADVVLKGNPISSEKIQKHHSFEYADLQSALNNLFA